MLRRFAIWAVVAVAAVLAVHVLIREGPPRSLLVPPRMELPALDDIAERAPPQRADPAVSAIAHEGRAVPAAQQFNDAVGPRKFQRRFMFDCGDVRIFVRVGEGEAALLPEGSLTGHWIPLARVGSEWRGRYANEELVFRPDGETAAFVLGKQTLQNCAAIRDRGALAEVNGGVFLQAFGDDPRWTFEITDRELTLSTDGGARRVEIPLRAPLDDGNRMTFRSVVGTQEMVATLDRLPCYDAASGETFELTAAVTFDRAWYYGCGRRISYR